MITGQQFHQLFPQAQDPEGWAKAMGDVFPTYDINTPQRVAAFLAQCGHESGGWTTFEENLNYSAQGLQGIFGSHFQGDADQYARQPEKIANRIYCNRMGNGDEASGDGWKYRGRGPIQLTGKANYVKFAQDMFDDWQNVVDNPDWVTADRDFALMSAIWFWNAHNLNKYADIGDIKTMTKIINGGYLGLDDRIAHYNEAIHLLA
jgi:putative chitinase